MYFVKPALLLITSSALLVTVSPAPRKFFRSTNISLPGLSRFSVSSIPETNLRRDDEAIDVADGFKLRRDDQPVDVADVFKSRRGDEQIDVADGFKFRRDEEEVDIADGF